MKQRERDLCPGYRGQSGTNGLCCCGLYWEEHCPPHDTTGKPLKLERIIKRKIRMAEARCHRIQAQQWYDGVGASRPLPKGYRIVKGGENA